MALDTKAQQAFSSGDENRLAALRAVLAAVVPDADLAAIAGAGRRIDEVLSGRARSPGWDRTLFPGWQGTRDGVRLAKRAIRVALHEHGLAATGHVFDLVYDFAEGAY